MNGDAVEVTYKTGGAAMVSLPVERDPEEIEAFAMTLVDRGIVKVTDDRTEEVAARFLADLATTEATVDRLWEPMKKATDAAHSIVCRQWHSVRDPIAALKLAQKNEIARFEGEKEREREKEEARLRAEVEAKEREAKAKHVEVLTASGNVEEAKAVAAEPVLPAAVTVARTKVEGISTRTVWGWERVDVSKAKREFLTWDEASIDAKVKAFGPEAEAIVGAGSIRITKTTDVRRTGGRKR